MGHKGNFMMFALYVQRYVKIQKALVGLRWYLAITVKSSSLHAASVVSLSKDIR